jgi:hypothetical protein
MQMNLHMEIGEDILYVEFTCGLMSRQGDKSTISKLRCSKWLVFNDTDSHASFDNGLKLPDIKNNSYEFVS